MAFMMRASRRDQIAMIKIAGQDVPSPNAAAAAKAASQQGADAAGADAASPAVRHAVVEYSATGKRVSVGTISAEAGSFFVDGRRISLDELFYQLQVQHLTNVDNALSDRLKELQGRNDQTKQYNELLEELRVITPSDSESTVQDTDVPSGATTSFSKWKQDFEDRYGYDITTKLSFNFPSGGANQTQITQWVETVKSKISTLNSDNQISQLQIERLNNQRNEILQGLSTFNKSKTETATTIVRNF